MTAIDIIGLGVMGAGHARYLTGSVPGARVAAVYDLDRSRAEAVAAEFAAEVADDPFSLIGGGSVAGVIVASPDATHVEFALACLEAGVPALIEKPLATDPADARRVADAETEAGLLSLGFMRRFDPQHLVLRRAIVDGTIGRPTLLRSVHRNPTPPPALTTWLVVTGSAIHDIDVARWLLGEFESVSASGRATRDTAAFDFLLIEGHHAGGAISSIEVFVSAGYGYEVTAEVVGTKGVTTTLAGDLAITRVDGASQTPYDQVWLDRFGPAYIAELTAWVRSLDTTEPFAGATARDGYLAQVVAEAVMRALETGRREPVEA